MRETANMMSGCVPSARYRSLPIVSRYGKEVGVIVFTSGVLFEERQHPGGNGVVAGLTSDIPREDSMESMKVLWPR